MTLLLPLWRCLDALPWRAWLEGCGPRVQGIVFSVRPPKKSWKNIVNLSGGEKTLSSLSLVFALHHYKPTPLYFMDEIDAALDFKNVSIVANYVKEQTQCALALPCCFVLLFCPASAG